MSNYDWQSWPSPFREEAQPLAEQQAAAAADIDRLEKLLAARQHDQARYRQESAVQVDSDPRKLATAMSLTAATGAIVAAIEGELNQARHRHHTAGRQLGDIYTRVSTIQHRAKRLEREQEELNKRREQRLPEWARQKEAATP